MANTSRGLLLALAATAIMHAGTITTIGQNAGVTLNATDLTGFTTLGSDMSGILVTATFAGGNVSCIWATTGPSSGGCAGAAAGVGSFSVSESGDTFSSNWTLTNTTPVGAAPIPLLNVLFDGLPGLVVFDRTFGGLDGTDGSAQGADATGTTAAGQPNGSATYSNLVATLGNPAVGDIFRNVNINFGNGIAPQTSGVWVMDTDKVGVRGDVPEPGTWEVFVLGGIALIAIGRIRRDRRKV